MVSKIGQVLDHGDLQRKVRYIRLSLAFSASSSFRCFRSETSAPAGSLQSSTAADSHRTVPAVAWSSAKSGT